MLHLDAFSGVSGNMFLGALLDAGLPRRELEGALEGLGLRFSLRVRRVRRGPLAARYVEVVLPSETSRTKGARVAKRTRVGGGSRALAGSAGRHAHAPLHHAPAGAGGHGHAHGRSYAEIRRLLERAKLAPAVRERALAIFELLGRAEAAVHGTRLERVHFHEVGAVDAIVDVTGAAAALSLLRIERVTCSPVGVGEGSVESAHGRLPLPAPATLELLKGVPVTPAHVAWETVTPTGAAILRGVVDGFRSLPALTVEAVGHGAGDDRPGPMPNVLRAVLGRTAGASSDRVVSLETNLDDFVPEHFDYLMERLLEAGALDVSLSHVQMKKNRPGFLVRVLARPPDRTRLAEILFAESTALGVRTQEWDRLVLARDAVRVATPYGTVRVKRAFGPEGGMEFSAEYDDCKRAARRSGAPLRQVVRAAEAAAREASERPTRAAREAPE